MKSITCILLSSAMAVSAVTLSTTTLAADTSEPLRHTVSYGDLNLSSETGARVLLARLRGAARSVCAPMDGRGPASFGRYRACVNNAMANAVADINQTIVTRVAKN